MKTRFAGKWLIPLSLSLAAIALAGVAQIAVPPAGGAQIIQAPPVSMGLWQTETTSTVTGVENTPMAGMAAAMGRPHVTQSCLTPDKWKSDIQGFNAKQQHGCTMSNLQQGAQEISFDEVCGQDGINKVHVDILIDSAEHAHGTVVMTVTVPNLPRPMTINTSMVTHYIGASCGDVKPGEGKMIK
jgi:hypothetical protein